MKNHYSVVVVGGGQAGLSISYCLKERGFDHIVFEKNRIGHSWRSKRWDSFCLVTPNWQCKLPGYHYSGDDPDGFMQKDEIVKYIEHYAKSFDPPVKEGVEVSKVRKSRSQDVFELSKSSRLSTAIYLNPKCDLFSLSNIEFLACAKLFVESVLPVTTPKANEKHNKQINTKKVVKLNTNLKGLPKQFSFQ